MSKATYRVVKKSAKTGKISREEARKAVKRVITTSKTKTGVYTKKTQDGAVRSFR